jgi:hypothetical protein
MFRAGETGGTGVKSATGMEQGSHVTLLAVVANHSLLSRLPFACALGKMGAV